MGHGPLLFSSFAVPLPRQFSDPKSQGEKYLSIEIITNMKLTEKVGANVWVAAMERLKMFCVISSK